MYKVNLYRVYLFLINVNSSLFDDWEFNRHDDFRRLVCKGLITVKQFDLIYYIVLI